MNPPPPRNRTLKFFRVFLWLIPFPTSLLVTLPAVYWLVRWESPLTWLAFLVIPFAVCFAIGLMEGLLDPAIPKEEGRPLASHWFSGAFTFALVQFICSPVLYFSLAIIITLLGQRL